MKQTALEVQLLRPSSLKWGLSALAALTVCLLWAYWPTLETMAERWSSDPQYSHGFLVPVFAAVVLWYRRDRFPAGRLAPSWWGLPWLLTGLALHVAGGQVAFAFLDDFSLLPTLAGLCLLLGGGPALRWSWPAIAFLGFMLPLPYRVELLLAHPLRRMATVASTYLLQLLGFPAQSEGNVILIDELRLGVVDACSGLGMLVTFFALSTAFALVIQRRLGDRIVLVLSAVPIALVANILRITATAVVHTTLGSAAANALMHDLAGWLMMPLALGLLGLELWFLGRLLLPQEAPRPLPLRLAEKPLPSPYPSRPGEPLLCEPLSAATPAPAIHRRLNEEA
jgi:exosortase